ncbi:hypothetical protein BLOT_000833 [Blomia tropicalis]|nr:hypothetical protein BLOT_000833 [Blomia tropicalis]
MEKKTSSVLCLNLNLTFDVHELIGKRTVTPLIIAVWHEATEFKIPKNKLIEVDLHFARLNSIDGSFTREFESIS